MGEFFDAVEWVGLGEEEAKKLVEKYNKEGKDAGFSQQSTAKRPRLDKTEGNKEARDSRNSRDTRDRRNNCEYFIIFHNYRKLQKYYIVCVFMGKIKIGVEILPGAAPIWEVGEERDHKGVAT